MKRFTAVFCFIIVSGAHCAANAHGINGHVWVTNQAVEYLTDCELINFFSEKEVHNAVQIASAFPDSGYAAKHRYGETAHWEPFTETYIQYLRAKGDDFLSTSEGKKQMAFLMGLSSHGMEDEIFDSIFLLKAAEADTYKGDTQEILDPATDFMLVSDGHTKLCPDVYFPGSDLVSVLTSPAIGVPVAQENIERGMFIVKTLVINLTKTKIRLDTYYRDKLPWARDHYFNADTPGSIAFEPFVVTHYLRALWNRLHGKFLEEDILIYSVPAPGQRLLSVNHKSVDSWITLFFGYGILDDTINSENVKLLDSKGKNIPADIKPNRWGGSKGSYSRLLQVRPKEDLQPDSEYTVTLSRNMKLITGENMPHKIVFRFKSPCGAESTASCKSVKLSAPEKPACEK